MKLIQPFQGWRPRPDLVEQVAAPPYDVLNRHEASCLAAGNPLSFLHVSKAEIDLDQKISPYDSSVYETARLRFQSMQSSGVLIQDPSPHLYFYRLTLGGRSQLGLVAAASVDAYLHNRIKKHEFTRPEKEADRTRLTEALSANTGPVFLVYKHEEHVDRLIAESLRTCQPIYDFQSGDGVHHTFWVLEDTVLIEKIVATFEEMAALYIADGHHRSAAAAQACLNRRRLDANVTGEEPFNRFLCVLFPDNHLQILDYNRVVRDLHGQSHEVFLQKITENFIVTPAAAPVRPNTRYTFGMYLHGDWYTLTLKPEKRATANPQAGLDVALLNTYLMEPILGIHDPRRDSRIDFVGGIRGLEGLTARVDSGEMAVAFSLFPTSLDDLMAVADADLVMPPKSTWFEPKLRDGLIIQEI